MHKRREQCVSGTDCIHDLIRLDRPVLNYAVVLLCVENHALVPNAHNDNLRVIFLPAFLDAVIVVALKIIVADI